VGKKEQIEVAVRREVAHIFEICDAPDSFGSTKGFEEH
jgi:hypothetical protein